MLGLLSTASPTFLSLRPPAAPAAPVYEQVPEAVSSALRRGQELAAQKDRELSGAGKEAGEGATSLEVTQEQVLLLVAQTLGAGKPVIIVAPEGVGGGPMHAHAFGLEVVRGQLSAAGAALVRAVADRWTHLAKRLLP